MAKKKKLPLKKRIPEILIWLMFVVGFLIFAYPTISDQWNTYRQSRLISNYESAMGEMSPEDFSAEWAKAEAYNKTITYNDFTQDVFSGEEVSMEGTEYWSVLNIGNDGIMGYLMIPKINQTIPIYHGTSDKVLQKAIGHLSGTSLPIGGEGTHCVVAAHRGLPSAKLFTDVDQLKEGDKFYAHILDKTFAYEVDQILPMVDKDDLDTLTGAMQIEEGKDYMTLLTCTPYGVNSHRLLIRGHQVEYFGENEKEGVTPIESTLQSVQNYYMLYGILTAAVLIVLYLIIRKVVKKRKGSK
ncbi:class C sortase [Frisingicoccus sp.]|uniref:class C sortase n=1 Tax=Frisingicoccus sp. TaxID=1918627 RepID=UPI003AB1816A